MKRSLSSLILAGAVLGSMGVAPVDPTTVFTGITAPSDTRKIGFDIRGVVAKVDVKKNDSVKSGQALISLDDREERARLDYFKKRADTSLAIAEAEQAYNVKKIDYERKKTLFENKESPGVASEFEVLTALAEMNIAEIKIKQAKHDGEVATAEMIAQQMRVDRMAVYAPIDGEINEVIIKAGEQVDESKPVIEIVDLDPLYIDLTLVPSHLVKQLKIGQTVEVRYKDEEWRKATVDAINLSMDARSSTHPFRLTMPNPEHRYGGDRIEVRMPSTATADAKQ